MANENWLWLLVVVGGPCLITAILILICIIRRRRARYLGVVPQRPYSFPASVLMRLDTFSFPKDRESRSGHLALTGFHHANSLDDSTSRDSVCSSPSTNGFIISTKQTDPSATPSD
jgi:hypothetical protein